MASIAQLLVAEVTGGITHVMECHVSNEVRFGTSTNAWSDDLLLISTLAKRDPRRAQIVSLLRNALQVLT